MSIQSLDRRQVLLLLGGLFAGACSQRGLLADTGIQPGADDLTLTIHTEINRMRANERLRRLDWDPRLAAVALAHSRDMASRNFFEHVTPEGLTHVDRYRAAGYQCRVPIQPGTFATGAENLFLGQRWSGTRTWQDGRTERLGERNDASVAEQVVTGWMNSPGHRRNLLMPYWSRQGVGVVELGDGRIYVTENFC